MQDVLKYMKIHAVTSPKFYKIIVGLTMLTMKTVNDLGGSMNDKESIEFIFARRNDRAWYIRGKGDPDDESLDDDEISDEVEEVEDNEVEVENIVNDEDTFYEVKFRLWRNAWLKKTKVRYI